MKMRMGRKALALCASIALLGGVSLGLGAAFQAFGPSSAAAATPRAQEDSGSILIGTDSNLPVPRFVSLKEEGANARRGPSTTQPILWIYQRADLPLQVTGESGAWRRVRDPDGAEVWMHKQNLSERQTFYIAAEQTALRSSARPGGRAIAYLEHGVVGRVTGCEGSWRRVTVGGRVGWVDQAALFGAGECYWR